MKAKLVKESLLEFNISSIVNKLDLLASKYGLEKTDISKETKLNNITFVAKWVIPDEPEYNFVLLYYEDEYDNLMINFSSNKVNISGNDSVGDWLDDEYWKRYFEGEADEEYEEKFYCIKCNTEMSHGVFPQICDNCRNINLR